MNEETQFEAIALIAIMGFLLDDPPGDVGEMQENAIERAKVFIRDNLAEALKKGVRN